MRNLGEVYIAAIIVASLLALVSIVGCTSMPNTMTPEQIAQVVKDKNGISVCAVYTGTGGQGRVVVVNLDEYKGVNGTVTVDPDCKTTVDTTTSYKPAAPVAVKP